MAMRLLVPLLACALWFGQAAAQSHGLSVPEDAEPDFWAVRGAPGGSRLNMREEPIEGMIVTGLPPGEVLRNRGCRTVRAERWCRVERLAGAQAGWVAARFLLPAPPAAAPAATEAEPAFDATGKIPCATIPGQTSRDCAFGVLRNGPGAASLRVTGSAGIVRYIYFDDGVPVRSDGEGSFTVERLNDLFLIRIGGERYEVPRAVIEAGTPSPAADPPAAQR
ncbi:hypothetical protein [Roseomonas sp. AR75]|uniref:hypothetical protein n=1 Tax=Roseomonas sp. AR75 TaxID=2562311 RepID=UPI0010BFA8F6|nr:hypothetical protein [Roseomonas sp. AR75]